MAASYPTSPKTFTVKTASQKVMAAHVNDMQYEIEAIETGLLNGTAPVNAAASTFTSLSVSGGSTLTTVQAGASTLTSLQSGASTLTSLNVAGGSTLRDLMPAADSTYALGNSTRKWKIDGGQLTTNTVPVAALASTAGVPSTATFYRGDGEWASPSAVRTMAACLVSLDTNITIGKAAITGVNWLVEDDDKFGMHSTAANSSRITFAESSGLYAIGCNVTFSTVTDNVDGRNAWCAIFRNDTVVAAMADATFGPTFADHRLSFNVAGMVRAESTSDYVTVRVYQNSNTNISLLSTGAPVGKTFWAQQVST